MIAIIESNTCASKFELDTSWDGGWYADNPRKVKPVVLARNKHKVWCGLHDKESCLELINVISTEFPKVVEFNEIINKASEVSGWVTCGGNIHIQALVGGDVNYELAIGRRHGIQLTANAGNCFGYKYLSTQRDDIAPWECTS